VRLLSITLMLVSSTFLLSSNSSLARHSQVSFSGSGRVFRLSSHFAILYFFSFSFLFWRPLEHLIFGLLYSSRFIINKRGSRR
jgi:hypothetical protein